jgi:alpha-tubulin suppressor-like RCC1 family protein
MGRWVWAWFLWGVALAQGLLAGGQGHSLAVIQGRLYAFGWNYDGQLGDGSFLNRSRPVRVLEGVLEVAAGNLHSLALLEGGLVLAFGNGERGQLGDGTFATKGKPVELPLKARGVAAGYSHTLVLGLDGRVYTAGSNEEGQLGDGYPPGAATGLPPWRACPRWWAWRRATSTAWPGPKAGSSTPGAATSRASWGRARWSPAPGRKGSSRGSVSPWGAGASPPFSLGTGASSSPAWTAPPSARWRACLKAVALAAGRAHLLVLGEDGRVYALGENEMGQLGDGTQEGRLEPRPVEGLLGVRAIGAGDAHSLALLADGRLFAWGDNRFGQLGDGTREVRLRPVQVRLP